MYNDFKRMCGKKAVKYNVKQCGAEWSEKYLAAICDVADPSHAATREERVKQLEAKEQALIELNESFQSEMQ